MNWFRRTLRKQGYAVLDICPEGLAAVQLSRGQDGRPAVTLFELREAQGLTPDLLQQSAAQWGLKELPLIALLGAGHYQTVLVEAPNVPEEELAAALRWQVKDLIPFAPDEAVVEHLPAPPGGAGRQAMVYVVAAQAAAIRALVEPYHQAGLDLEVIDVHETAQRNLAALLEPEGYAAGLLHCDVAGGLLTFTSGGDMVMSRRIEGRGATGGQLQGRIALEVQRSVDYFERQYHTLPLAKLFLAPMPGSESMLGRLREALSIPVEAVDLEQVLDIGQHDALRDARVQNAVFHLVGAALRTPAA